MPLCFPVAVHFINLASGTVATAELVGQGSFFPLFGKSSGQSVTSNTILWIQQTSDRLKLGQTLNPRQKKRKMLKHLVIKKTSCLV